MTDLERAEKVFKNDVYAWETTGCRIDEVRPGYSRCSVKVGPQHLNALKIPMGGVMFTLADFAYAVASNFDRDVYVSTAADVHFMKSAKGDILYAEAKEIRTGRRTCLFSVEISDNLGTQVAYLTITGVRTMERKKLTPEQGQK